jgi:hypothetical protein
MSGPPPQRARPSLNDTTPITCPCGCQIFSDGFMLREMSRLITGDAEDVIIRIPIVVCKKCGVVLQKMLPPELKEKKVDILEK